MKKFLLATTFLAATTSLAAAEISMSGDARMGIVQPFDDPTTLQNENDATAFTSRARVKFTLSGETDGGLSFGASFRANDASGASKGTNGEVFISGAFGKLSMGDVDGAAQQAVGNVDGVGLTGLGDTNELMFFGGGGFTITDPLAGGVSFSNDWQMTGDPTAVYEYTSGGISVYASATQPSYIDPFGGGPDKGYALGAAYVMGDYKVSGGYEAIETTAGGSPDGSIYNWVIGADATYGAVVVKARYASAKFDATGSPMGDLTQYALSATYTTGPVAVTGFASRKHLDDELGASLGGTDAFGIGAAYDLGGGASVNAGYVNSKLDELGTKTTAGAFDLGVSFSF